MPWQRPETAPLPRVYARCTNQGGGQNLARASRHLKTAALSLSKGACRLGTLRQAQGYGYYSKYASLVDKHRSFCTAILSNIIKRL